MRVEGPANGESLGNANESYGNRRTPHTTGPRAQGVKGLVLSSRGRPKSDLTDCVYMWERSHGNLGTYSETETAKTPTTRLVKTVSSYTKLLHLVITQTTLPRGESATPSRLSCPSVVPHAWSVCCP